MQTPRWINLAIGALIGLAIALGLVWLQAEKDEARRSEMRGAALSPADIDLGGPFTLTDQRGQKVTDQTYRGKVLFLTFGFTFCPDVCPTSLHEMSLALDQLSPEELAGIQPLFVTIDPERDTPAVLARYVAMFHPAFIGLSGTAAETAAIAKAYKVYYARAKGEAASDSQGAEANEYMMDHTTLIYVMGRDGKFVRAFRSGSEPEEMVAALKQALGQTKGQALPTHP